MTSKAKPILIIDLDETLISVNSFPLWARYFLLGKFKDTPLMRRASLRLEAARIFAARKLLRKNHAQTKSKLHQLWMKVDDTSAQEKFISALERYIRPNMRELLELIAKKEIDAILATAAASAYAEPFARKIGFTYVLATRISDNENRNEEKSRQALELIAKNNWLDRKKIFFTDHLEDMPFMLNSNKLFWFGREDEIGLIKQSAPNLDVIYGKNIGAQDILKAALEVDKN